MGKFTGYNDITDLALGDKFLVFDASEASGDKLANITWSNLLLALKNGTVNVKTQYGAVGDGVANDTTAIKRY